jgi:hypothetical protein
MSTFISGGGGGGGGGLPPLPNDDGDYALRVSGGAGSWVRSPSFREVTLTGPDDDAGLSVLLSVYGVRLEPEAPPFPVLDARAPLLFGGDFGPPFARTLAIPTGHFGEDAPTATLLFDWTTGFEGSDMGLVLGQEGDGIFAGGGVHAFLGNLSAGGSITAMESITGRSYYLHGTFGPAYHLASLDSDEFAAAIEFGDTSDELELLVHGLRVRIESGLDVYGSAHFLDDVDVDLFLGAANVSAPAAGFGQVWIGDELELDGVLKLGGNPGAPGENVTSTGASTAPAWT